MRLVPRNGILRIPAEAGLKRVGCGHRCLQDAYLRGCQETIIVNADLSAGGQIRRFFMNKTRYCSSRYLSKLQCNNSGKKSPSTAASRNECHSGGRAQRGSPEPMDTGLWNMGSG